MYTWRTLRCWVSNMQPELRCFGAPGQARNKKCGDSWEEVGAAANFRCPREEERDT